MIRTIILCVLYALLNVGGASIIKTKLKNTALSTLYDWISFLFQIPVIFALTLIFVSVLLLFKTLQSNAFTLVAPITIGLNFIMTVFVGVFLFKDNFNFLTGIGITLMLIGIIVLSLSQGIYEK
jgi:multidrug transporter EmrE-like cation transporter